MIERAPLQAYLARVLQRPVELLGLQGALIGIFGTSLLCITALAGCSPLPGRTLDPVYLKVGTEPASESTQTSSAPAKASPPVVAKAAGASVWVGRYRDSRGEGDVTFSLVRGESTMAGTWTLRTGGGGPLTGVVEAGGQRWRTLMENTAPECPAVFEGWMEMSQTGLVGTYHGRDCEGPVTDGRLELRPR